MDDEFIYNELKSISSKLSSTDTNVARLKESMDKVCDWKDDVLSNLQQCNDYMNARQTLPQRLDDHEKEIEKIKITRDHDEEANSKTRKQNEFLMTWYWRIAGIILFLTALNFILVLYGRYIDLTGKAGV